MGTIFRLTDSKLAKLLMIIEMSPGFDGNDRPDLLLPPSGKNSIELPLLIRFLMC